MYKWRTIAKPEAHEHRHEKFSKFFFTQGYKRRAMKGLKLWAHLAGNVHYEKRMKEKITIEVENMVITKKSQFTFLESMIKELEEKYRIELRKKAIVKNALD